MEEQKIVFHISSTNEMTLKYLSETLDLINLSVNDYYRECGIKNNTINKLSPRVTHVSEGSVYLELAMLVMNHFVAPLLIELIKTRLRKKECNSRGKTCHENISVIGDNNVINININH